MSYKHGASFSNHRLLDHDVVSDSNIATNHRCSNYGSGAHGDIVADSATLNIGGVMNIAVPADVIEMPENIPSVERPRSYGQPKFFRPSFFLQPGTFGKNANNVRRPQIDPMINLNNKIVGHRNLVLAGLTHMARD